MLNNWVSLSVTVQHTSVWDRFGYPPPWVLWQNGESAASHRSSKRSPCQFVSSRAEECWLVGHTILCYFQLHGILMMESQGFHKLMHPDRASARSSFNHFWPKKPFRCYPIGYQKAVVLLDCSGTFKPQGLHFLIGSLSRVAVAQNHIVHVTWWFSRPETLRTALIPPEAEELFHSMFSPPLFPRRLSQIKSSPLPSTEEGGNQIFVSIRNALLQPGSVEILHKIFLSDSKLILAVILPLEIDAEATTKTASLSCSSSLISSCQDTQPSLIH